MTRARDSDPRVGLEKTVASDVGSAPTLAGAPSATADTVATADPVASLPGAGAALLPVSRSMYEVMGEHSRGGLGRILSARDRRSGRVVAIKETLSDDAGTAARFQREALITSNLQHPAIVPVYEVGRWDDDDRPFYAMKLVAGRSLAEAIARAGDRVGRLALLPHVIDIAEAMEYAHSRNIIHRDLKPANILVGRFGETVVIDWGLAKNLLVDDDDGSDGSLPAHREETAAGSLIGTPAYMSPEQARGEEVDERADVYALGAILYQLLAGVPPYASASSAHEVIARVQSEPPRPLAELEPELPSDLIAIVEKAMALDARDRYLSAAELAADLRRFRDGQLVAAHHYSGAERIARWLRRHRGVVIVAAAALVLLSVFGAYSVQRIRSQRDIARRERTVAERARARAERATAEARATMADLDLELGRRELTAGAPERAASYLLESARLRGEITPALAHLIGRAREPFTPRKWLANGHRGPVVALQLAADGKTALTASSDGTLVVWNVADGSRRATFAAGFEVSEAALSADGTKVAAAGRGLAVWNVADRRKVATLRVEGKRVVGQVAFAGADRVVIGDTTGHVEVWKLGAANPERRWKVARSCGELSVSPDGSHLVTVGAQGDRAAIWDVASGRLRARLPKAHDGTPILFTRAGDRVLLVDVAQRSAGLFRVADGSELVRVVHPPGPSASRIVIVGLTPDGSRILTGATTDTSTLLWDTATGTVIRPLAGHALGPPPAAAAAPTSDVVATGDPSGTIRLWSARTGWLRRRLRLPGESISLLAFSADGASLVAISWNGVVSAWDVGATPTRMDLPGHRGQVRRAVYLSNDVVVTGGRDGALRFFGARDGKLLRAVANAHREKVSWLAVDPGGQRVISASHDGTAAVWTADGSRVRTLSPGGGPLASALFLAGGRVATAGENGVVTVWGTDERPICATAPSSTPLFGAIASPDGSLIAAYHVGPQSALWRANDCALARRLPTGQDNTVNAAFSPDGKRLILTGFSKHSTPAVVFDVESGAPTPLTTQQERITAASAFFPDSRRVATGHQHGTVRVWDSTTGKVVQTLSDAQSLLVSLAVHPSGDYVVAGEDSGTLRAWDVASGVMLTAWKAHDAGIYWMRLRPDGAQVLTTALDDTPRLWSFPLWRGTIADVEAQLRRIRRTSASR